MGRDVLLGARRAERGGPCVCQRPTAELSALHHECALPWL